MKKIIFLAVIIYLVIINAAGFVFMFIDKKKAKRRRRRIPEAVLMTISAIGGGVGTLAGMEIFRHKTNHASFYIGIPVMIVIQLALVFLFIKLF